MALYRSSNYNIPNTDYKIVGYAESRESYVATTEQVVEFCHVPGSITGYKHSPSKVDMYKDHKTSDKPKSFIVPWSSPRSSPKKADHDYSSSKWSSPQGSPKKANRDDFNSSKLREEGFNGKSRNGYREIDSLYGKHNNSHYFANDHEDDEDKDVVYYRGEHSPKYFYQEDDDHHHEYDNHYGNKEGNGFAPHAYTHPSSTHQTRKETYYETPNVVNHHEKNQGNGYAPHSKYIAPPPTQARTKDVYYEPPNSHNHVKQKGSNANTSNVQMATQPRTHEAYYEAQKPVSHEKNSGTGYLHPTSSYKVPDTMQPMKFETYSDNNPKFGGPPIKTRRETEFSNENGMNSPLARKPLLYGSPRKDDESYQETVKPMKFETYSDNNPRFGGQPIKTRRETEFSSENKMNSPLAHKPQSYGSPRKYDEGYRETIDSKEAAIRYKGVFVPY